MDEEIEIWRAANQLVKRYGADAGFEAAKRTDAMIERRRKHRCRVWSGEDDLGFEKDIDGEYILYGIVWEM